MSSNNPSRIVKAPAAAQKMPPLEQVLKKRHILITGATGFLGKGFLYLLLRWHPEVGRIHLLIRGDRRSSLGRFRREILDSPVMGPLREYLGHEFDRYVEDKIAVLAGDITEEGLLTAGEERFQCGTLDAVIHCAGLVNFEASLEKALLVNTVGVANVIKFCRKYGSALLHVSTCYAAGNADGHRFEDDVPANWCPNGRRGFALQREIRDALAAIDRVEAESHDQGRLAELHAQAQEAAASDGRDAAVEGWRKRWVEDRLKDVGRQRALSWGWPNTYSYTKSLGEQLVLAARGSIAAAVVRPSVIESALCDPFPGWNQGVNTSAPLTYLAGRGYRFYPAKGELVLDVIPVDLAAHAMIPILAAVLLNRHRPVYQLCTSDTNPLQMQRLVELTSLSNRREHRKTGNGPMGKLAPHLEAVVVSQSTYDLMSRTLPGLLKRAAALSKLVLGDKSAQGRKFEEQVERLLENTEMARSMVEVYRPYIQELVYTFHSDNIRALYKTLVPGDAARHPFHPERIDWGDYWANIHLPGLRRHIFPHLDLHTRARPRTSFRHKTLLELLDNAAERYGARTALIARRPSGERTSLSYRELHDKARRGALLLGGRGVKPGDRVLLIAENSPDWVLACFAILSAGAIAVPLDHMISAAELEAISRIAAPKAALVSASVSRRLGPTIREAAGTTAEIELSELGRPFILRAKAAVLPQAERKTLASVVFTSGTTGTPKGVMLTHGNFAAEVAMLARVFSLGSNDIVLSLLPLHHTFEFTCGMLLPLAAGATIVYPLEVDAASLSRTLADVRPTALIGVPALWEAVHRRILDEAESHGPFFMAAFDGLRDLNRRLDSGFSLNLGGLLFRQVHAALGGRLKLAVSGGAPLPPRVAEFFNEIGIRLLEGYGLTEAAPVLSTARPDEALKPGSVGRPLNGAEIRIAGGNGDGLGEIVARGPNIMAGYYRNQAATDEVLKDGWLHTGDLGRFDADGRLYIVGRAKDVIVDSGGNNIYIDELEQAYGHSPYVKELAVVGVKVGQSEQVAALVVPAYARGESRHSVEDKLRVHFEKVSAGLNRHKRIKILRFTESELPRTRTRKIKRAEVAALLERMLENRVEEGPCAGGDVEPWIAQALAQVSSAHSEVSPATRLIEDLGLDSLALAELGEHVAMRAGRELTSEQLSNLRTVDDLQRLLIGQGQSRPRLPSYARFAQPFTPTLPAPLRHLGESAFHRAQRVMFESWLKPRVMGCGNIPSNRNVLVVANHASHLDFGLVAYSLGPIGKGLVVLAAKDYFFNTAIRRFAMTNFTRLIPFDRERAQIESLGEALGELAAGRSVLMFPEGTRSPDGAIHEFKSGVGYLALRSGCDVLPINISGTYKVLGKGSLLPHHHLVEVRIGRVITADELRRVAEDAEGTGAYRKLAAHMRQAVVSLTERPAFSVPLAAANAKIAAVQDKSSLLQAQTTGGNGQRAKKRAKG